MSDGTDNGVPSYGELMTENANYRAWLEAIKNYAEGYAYGGGTGMDYLLEALEKALGGTPAPAAGGESK